MATTVLPEGTSVANGRYTVEEKVGQGGAGEVYRVMQNGLNLYRALKVLNPSTEGAQLALYNDTFTSEIRLLASVTHHNVVKIIDYGEDKHPESQSPYRYFVMEYINDGPVIHARQHLDRPDALVQLIGDVIEGLAYLHDHAILHCDIKPANILVQHDPDVHRWEAKVADLGVAKPLYDQRYGQAQLEGMNRTHVYGTRKYAPEQLKKWLGRDMDRSELRSQWFPYWDLYCLGGTIAEILSLKSVSTRPELDLPELQDNPHPLASALDADELDYFWGFTRRLLRRSADGGFRDMNEVRAAFERREPRRALPWQVPELVGLGCRKSIVLGDGMLKLTDRCYRLINHPRFQRLQKLSQLGFIDLVYPDARHSRLSHSLRTFRLAAEIVKQLLGDHRFRLVSNADDAGLFLCSALLHDIGHYPLMHTIEDLRYEFAELPAPEQVLADHQLAQQMLEEKGWDDVESIAELLGRDWGLTAGQVAAMVGKHAGTEELSTGARLLRRLLDGALDVDKMAYLEQDSQFTGVRFGHGIDREALIASMVVVEGSDGIDIGISEKGQSAAESLIGARYHMFARVYWHHTNRAVMAMVRYVAARVLDPGGGLSFQEWLKKVVCLSEWEALALLQQEYKQRGYIDKHGGDPLAGLLTGSRRIYKRLVSYAAYRERRQDPDHRFLGTASPLLIEKLRQQCVGELSTLTAKHAAGRSVASRAVRDADVLFDIPRIDKGADALADMLVKGEGRRVASLSDISHVVGAVHQDFEAQVKKARVYIHPDLSLWLERGGLTSDAANIVREVIAAQRKSLE